MKELFKNFERDGYVVLKRAMLKNECKKLIKKTIVPILHKKGIYLTKFNKLINKKRISGKLIYGKNGGHIISRKNSHFRFSELFNSKLLNTFLNKYHKRNFVTQVTKVTQVTNLTFSKWYYSALASEGLGWIHLRFPYYKYNDKENENVKYEENSFHLDGLEHNNEINYKQSLILLPFITKVNKNEGGTAVIPGSHKLINEHILRYNYKTNKNLEPFIDKIVNQNRNKIIDVIGEQGDILIMHPHLIHSSSLADINSNVRITFNISTEIY